ncbi:polysaccharide biosynthesis/export family protein [Algoriphagus sediminis]|uniref:Polysaccharide biosynthesis/export family protein n=1 Tax=Algoriphagus sediminis TaxID=3057113 RepID=A0ABT7YEI3_9BACT|nr:polysaccharide biosynthesis/export family protein [Algoriphagus sediminis]MDN3204750.1 polysaccharide biosynthesis/export family protein [Algoriphagus sediminis]
MKNRVLSSGALLLLVLVFFSCVSNKKLIYMQQLEEDEAGVLVESSQRYPYEVEDYLLQVNDIVEINIKTTDPRLNEIFGAITADPNNNMGMMGGGQGAGDAFFMNGYTIDDRGLVEIPLLGEVKLLGLSTEEAKILVEGLVSQLVNEGEYFVRVRLGGVRFSALGEFRRSGKFTILQNRVTIFEAIAFAGDLTTVANRNEILLVRQYPDGSQIHKINLLDRELLGSEFYFLRPNDMIYAEPMRVRELGAGTNVVETLTLLTTTITAIALVLTLINN